MFNHPFHGDVPPDVQLEPPHVQLIAQGDNHCPGPSGHIISDTSQDAIGPAVKRVVSSPYTSLIPFCMTT